MKLEIEIADGERAAFEKALAGRFDSFEALVLLDRVLAALREQYSRLTGRAFDAKGKTWK